MDEFGHYDDLIGVEYDSEYDDPVAGDDVSAFDALDDDAAAGYGLWSDLLDM
jgi:hypothetical protein